MYDLLYSRLKCIESGDRKEYRLFPMLILLSRLYPTTTSGNFPLAPFLPNIFKTLLNARTEKIRILAVNAICSVAQPDDWTLILEWFYGQISKPNTNLVSCENALHGVIVLVGRRHLLQTNK